LKIIIGKYEATIYPEGDGFTGAISLGFDAAGRRQRVKRKGRTKTEVRDKLREVVDDLEAGVLAVANYTVADAVNDYLAHGLKGKSPETVSNYRSLAAHHLIPHIGAAQLKALTADQLDEWTAGRRNCPPAHCASSTRSWNAPFGTPRPATRSAATSPASSTSPKDKKAAPPSP